MLLAFRAATASSMVVMSILQLTFKIIGHAAQWN